MENDLRSQKKKMGKQVPIKEHEIRFSLVKTKCHIQTFLIISKTENRK